MAITAKQKVYGCVLGAGVAAFAADKVFLAPNEAAAQSLPVAEYAITSLTSELDAARSDLAAMALVPAESNELAGSLEAFAQTRSLDLTNIRDAFKPSTSWGGNELVIERRRAADDLAATFAQSHRLMAVMGAGPNGSAIINDKCLFIGQQIDGFRLASVGSRNAVLELDDAQVELELSQQQ